MNPYWSAPGDAPAIGSLLLSRLFLPTASGSSVSDAGVGLLGKPSSRNLYFSPALSMPPLEVRTRTGAAIPIERSPSSRLRR